MILVGVFRGETQKNIKQLMNLWCMFCFWLDVVLFLGCSMYFSHLFTMKNPGGGQGTFPRHYFCEELFVGETPGTWRVRGAHTSQEPTNL